MTSLGLDLADERWADLCGGYRVPYDPRAALQSLARGEDMAGAWNDLWQGLYHQGDIGDAAYAVLPHLVDIHERRGVPDWNTYALAAAVELARDRADNPELPADLQEPYKDAWVRLTEAGLRELNTAEDATLVVSIIAVLAIAKGQRAIGRLTIDFTEDERQELLAQADAP